MSEAPTEIEAKFEVGDADRDRLAQVDSAGDFRVTGRKSIEQHDVYYDTETSSLATAGSTLRIRRSVKGAVMTFKGKRVAQDANETHVAERLEDEVALPETYERMASQDVELPVDEKLSPLRRALALVGDRPLNSVATLDNHRIVIDLTSSTGQHCELALDTCVATRLRDGRVVTFGEVELEAKSADRAVLGELAAALQAIAPTLISSHRTKLERALR